MSCSIAGHSSLFIGCRLLISSQATRHCLRALVVWGPKGFVSVVGLPFLPAVFVESEANVADVAGGHCIPPQSPCTAEEVGFPFLQVDEMGTSQIYQPVSMPGISFSSFCSMGNNNGRDRRRCKWLLAFGCRICLKTTW